MEYHQGRREAIGIQFIFNQMQENATVTKGVYMILMGNQWNINREEGNQWDSNAYSIGCNVILLENTGITMTLIIIQRNINRGEGNQ